LILKHCINNDLKLRITPFFRDLETRDNDQRLSELVFRKERYFASIGDIFCPEESSCQVICRNIRINSDGRISPCCFHDDSSFGFGNVKDDALLNIILSGDYQRFLAGSVGGKGACKVCMDGYASYGRLFR